MLDQSTVPSKKYEKSIRFIKQVFEILMYFMVVKHSYVFF